MPKIPKLTKTNAIMVLTDILSEFRSVTGEYAGAVFSWHGKLGSLGPEKFQTYITRNSDEIARTLLTNQISTSTSALSKPVRDHEILKLLDEDISGYNVQGLRRLVSAIIKVSTGNGMFFWNDPSLKPPYWPERVPFENIKSAYTSDDSFDEFFQQPVIASNKPISDPQTPIPTSSLVTLLGVKPLDLIQIITPPISLNEKNLSISELSSTLLKKNFPHLQGLQDTILSENRQFVKAPRLSIQLHHDGALHWVCSSIDVEGHVPLYDSLSTGRISGELAVQLDFLYGNDADHELKVALAPIQQQRGEADCGLFAAAVCLTIAMGGDPTQVYWKQSRMRSHLTDSFNSGILAPFPKLESIVLLSPLTTNLGTDLKIKL
ncbi:hypothetical protein LOD99_5361 [Oopsacas minuta]|uniref:Nuclear respiratory factor 1 NLS/DNA-binding dimerisation domain-containing protein n=1 Tax=Oopsacas minuta TaxID=111878 RepID=A0AAV7JRP3_9METZ|nr:hypothetical protein LOD99_5361 [Oopsacas minuta]